QGAIVSYAPTASDNCAGTSVVCVPVSGSLFRVGDSTVQCTATDASANQSSCSFNVHVKGAAEQVADLITAVNNLSLPSDGIKNALLAKLNAALAQLQNDKNAAACGLLQAFINLVDA